MKAHVFSLNSAAAILLISVSAILLSNRVKAQTLEEQANGRKLTLRGHFYEMIGRCNNQGRLALLKRNGGTVECEKAISRALEYLKTIQNPDGSWERSFKGAATGLALLCYLHHCETPDSPFYGDTVMKGAFYLIELSKHNDGLMAVNAITGSYEHAVATHALGLLYSWAKVGNKNLPGLREAFSSGVKMMINDQSTNNNWFWGYSGNYYKELCEGDPVGIGWRYQALLTAKHTELPFVGLDNAIERIVKYIATQQNKDGSFGGFNRESQGFTAWTMTPIAVSALQTFSPNQQATIKRGVGWYYEFLKKEPLNCKPAPSVIDSYNASPYVWYNAAEMLFRNGGQEWTFWSQTALPEILSNQQKDGSWSCRGKSSVYSTALYTLILEVLYNERK